MGFMISQKKTSLAGYLFGDEIPDMTDFGVDVPHG
jgi:hypothetical protein